MADRIRTTISLNPEVHAIFVQMAEASGVSVSRCMGDWLADTADGAQFVALKVKEARSAPKTVLREFQAFTVGLHDALGEQIAGAGRRGDAAEPHTAAASPSDLVSELVARAKGKKLPKAPPSSNTGGKVPRAGAQGRGKTSGR